MLRRLILWDFPRGSRSYDLVVALILAFIFFTPRDWFRDQPRLPKASSIAILPAEHGSMTFFVDAGVPAHIPEDQRIPRLTEILRSQTGNRKLTVLRVEPILGAEGDLHGYMAFARP
jgi:hypothetical protein